MVEFLNALPWWAWILAMWCMIPLGICLETVLWSWRQSQDDEE